MLRPLGARRLLRPLLLAVALAGAAGCAPRIDTRGNLPDPERVSEITVGTHSRDDVADILGSPSSVSAFGDETWYYISKRTETLAFLAPEVTESNILVIHFDEGGKVDSVEHRGLADARSIVPVARVTPTAGNELTFLDQLLGNFGRFSKAGSAGGLPGS